MAIVIATKDNGLNNAMNATHISLISNTRPSYAIKALRVADRAQRGLDCCKLNLVRTHTPCAPIRTTLVISKTPFARIYVRVYKQTPS